MSYVLLCPFVYGLRGIKNQTNPIYLPPVTNLSFPFLEFDTLFRFIIDHFYYRKTRSHLVPVWSQLSVKRRCPTCLVVRTTKKGFSFRTPESDGNLPSKSGIGCSPLVTPSVDPDIDTVHTSFLRLCWRHG